MGRFYNCNTPVKCSVWPCRHALPLTGLIKGKVCVSKVNYPKSSCHFTGSSLIACLELSRHATKTTEAIQSVTYQRPTHSRASASVPQKKSGPHSQTIFVLHGRSCGLLKQSLASPEVVVSARNHFSHCQPSHRLCRLNPHAFTVGNPNPLNHTLCVFLRSPPWCYDPTQGSFLHCSIQSSLPSEWRTHLPPRPLLPQIQTQPSLLPLSLIPQPRPLSLLHPLIPLPRPQSSSSAQASLVSRPPSP